MELKPEQEAQLYAEYEPLVYRVAKDTYGIVKSRSAYWKQSHLHHSIDPEDVIQEGKIALLRAIREHDESKAPLRLYAYILIHNAMTKFTRRENKRRRAKPGHGSDNMAVVPCVNEETGFTEFDFFDKRQQTGDEMVEWRDFYERCVERLRGKLTDDDIALLAARANGMALKEIAEKLGSEMQAARRRLKSITLKASQILEPERGEQCN